ncbi:hypothetical protein GYMLUDRAFT_249308 [Collybiopsis luxurians FD-317 M1]|uniref:Uncharacterized protein n=1 Tax=Collybiopsis luxurians FD-317 M1 TaxID=944289 RepID=A0A0D0CI20_9AGAR|nr:hypothetical protein GYMLUDRAFT_249308 [Collybiopsis luxurians FD-317 M1]
MTYEMYQLCVFGWAIDPVSGRAVQWGGDPLFKGMKTSNATAMRLQCADYSAMIHMQHMWLGQEGVLLPEKQCLIDGYLKKRAWIWSAVKEIFLILLCELHPDADIKQMQWGDNFADLCYRHQVTLVNWPKGVRIPGFPGEQNGLSEVLKLPLDILKCIVKDRIDFWKSQLKILAKIADPVPLYEDDSSDKASDEDTGSVPLNEEDLVQFVSWDDEQKALPVLQMGNIAILKKYQKCIENFKFIAGHSDEDEDEDEGEDEDDGKDEDEDDSEDKDEDDSEDEDEDDGEDEDEDNSEDEDEDDEENEEGSADCVRDPKSQKVGKLSHPKLARQKPSRNNEDKTPHPRFSSQKEVNDKQEEPQVWNKVKGPPIKLTNQREGDARPIPSKSKSLQTHPVPDKSKDGPLRQKSPSSSKWKQRNESDAEEEDTV